MRLPDVSPFRTSIFRLTALYVVCFSLSVGLLFAIVGYVTRSSMRAQISNTVQREARVLADEYDETKGFGAAELIKQRLQRGTFSYFLLQDAGGGLIAGNISPVQLDSGLHDLTVHRRRDATRPESGEEAGTRKAIGFGIRRSDGTFVLVANDAERIDQVESAIGTAFAIGGGASALLAILGGVALSVSFLRRIEAINRTSREIMDGRFDARIPVLHRNDELDLLALNLNATFDRIEKLMDSLKQISSDVAHDLRTPLSRLRQTLELARTSSTSVEEFRTATEAAIAEANGLLETFAALLRIAQIESGSRRKGFVPVDLSGLMQSVAEIYAAVAEDAEHELTARVESDVIIDGDRELLLQLASNLVENAIRHTASGSRIELELHRIPGGIVADFADNGPGIPETEREKVFRRFYRLERSRTTSGSGLGLALVAAIAELHGAEITLSDNQPGLRLTIRFAEARPSANSRKA